MLVGLIGALQQRGSPSPVTHNVDCDEACLYGAPAGVELLRAALSAASKFLVQQHHACIVLLT